MSDISKNIIIFKVFFTIFVLIFLILLLFLSINISWSNYNSILEIASQLQDNTLVPDNEIKYITDNIINLKNLAQNEKEKNFNIEATLVSKLDELKKAQFFALQTQITPHFIFNTLNLVSAIVMNITKGPNDAEKVVSLLSNILYYSLREKNYFVDIKDEIDYTQKYIEIEKIKRKNNFDVEFEYADNIRNYKTLKFILQPIVENCFVHSFPYTDKRGFLKIKIFEADKCINFEIYDNGNKISEDKLNNIKRDLVSDELPMSTHLGLRNINTRIKLLWGNEYGCFIASENSGTTVTIKTPIFSDFND